jgi:hypothetical protein
MTAFDKDRCSWAEEQAHLIRAGRADVIRAGRADEIDLFTIAEAMTAMLTS